MDTFHAMYHSGYNIWNYVMFYKNSNSPQVKRTWANIRKILKLDRDIAPYPISLPHIKLWQKQPKVLKRRNQSFLVLYSFTGFLHSASNTLPGTVAPPHARWREAMAKDRKVLIILLRVVWRRIYNAHVTRNSYW